MGEERNVCMKKIIKQNNGWTDKVYYITRTGTLLALVMMFFPAANPAYVSGLINKNLSLFTTAISYDSLTSLAGRPLRMGWVESMDFVVLMIGAAILCLGIVLMAACACMSLGNLKMKRTGNWFGLAGTVVMFGGMAGIYLAYQRFCASGRPDKVYTTKLENGEYINEFPFPMYLFLVLAVIAYLLLHKSKYGRKVFLVGTNKNAAEYCGINSRLVIMSTYMLSGLAAGIAGCITTAYVGSSKCDLGSTSTMSIITAVVLGGTLSTGGKGSVIGTALAALVVGIMRFGLPLSFKVNSQYLDVPDGHRPGFLLRIAEIGGQPPGHQGRFIGAGNLCHRVKGKWPAGRKHRPASQRSCRKGR